MQKKSVFKMICLCLAMCILFSSCQSSKTLNAPIAVTDYNTPEELKTPSDETVTVKKTDFAELLFDKKTFTVGVRDLQTSYVWQTLAGDAYSDIGALSLWLYTSAGIHYLNTQDNSVAFGTASYEIKDEMLTVSYVMSDNKKTAEKSYEDVGENDVYVALTVSYSLNQQSMTVSVDFGSALCTPSGFIGSVRLLPCFGSSKTDSSSDYFLIPDNSGAVMYLAKENSDLQSVSVNVYGTDPYLAETEASASATVPVFGVKRQNSAFAAVITEGDSLAKIKASASSENSSSVIYPEFAVTPVAERENGGVYYGKRYEGKISVTYKFLAKENANYIGMASSAREVFISNGMLSSLKTEENISIPFYLNLVAKEKNEILTTADRAFDMLGVLKGKGINNISVIYDGLFASSKGTKNLYGANVSPLLGGNDGLENLYRFIVEQGCKLYLGSNILSASSLSLSEKITDIKGENAIYKLENSMGFSAADGRMVTRIGDAASKLGAEKENSAIYSQTEYFEVMLHSAESVRNNFSDFLESKMLSSADGLSFTDAGTILSSSKNSSREDAKKVISDASRATDNYGGLIVENGNIYAVYSADLVSEMKFSTFYKESQAYVPVPFVQAILHGYVLYTGEPIDAGDPLYRYDMLQFIEYGALPSYQWIYENKNIFCYSGYMQNEQIEEITDFYSRAENIFSSLSDDTIVSHTEILKDAEGNALTGVYCTGYSDGTEIYVNYTGSIVTTTGNIAIGPYDFVAVKG